MLITARENILSSIVLVMEATQVKTPSVRDLEAELEAMAEVGQMVSPDGTGVLIRVPKKNLEIVLTPKRLEIAYRSDRLTEVEAHTLASVAHHLIAGYVENAQYKSIGFNYVVVFKAPDGKTAIESIGESTLPEGLGRKLGYELKGSAFWLFLDVEGKTLWLRLEPRASDRRSGWVWANGNFHADLGDLPAESQLSHDLLHLYNVFLEILEKL